jgi:uncharacterized glyoxalase superfamily protein PhnB
MKNRSAPSATVVPVVIYEDVEEALNWLCATFGFSERLRVARPGSPISHAQLSVDEGAIMLGRAGGPYAAPTPDRISQYVHVTVDDIDNHYERTKGLGARILQPPNDMPFGERQYTAQDLGGHWWTFSQHTACSGPHPSSRSGRSRVLAQHHSASDHFRQWDH